MAARRRLAGANTRSRKQHSAARPRTASRDRRPGFEAASWDRRSADRRGHRRCPSLRSGQGPRRAGRRRPNPNLPQIRSRPARPSTLSVLRSSLRYAIQAPSHRLPPSATRICPPFNEQGVGQSQDDGEKHRKLPLRDEKTRHCGWPSSIRTRQGLPGSGKPCRAPPSGCIRWRRLAFRRRWAYVLAGNVKGDALLGGLVGVRDRGLRLLRVGKAREVGRQGTGSAANRVRRCQRDGARGL